MNDFSPNVRPIAALVTRVWLAQGRLGEALDWAREQSLSALSGPDIARELMASLNTLRTHTKNIYDKLGVNNRRAAVKRAEELKLL